MVKLSIIIAKINTNCSLLMDKLSIMEESDFHKIFIVLFFQNFPFLNNIIKIK
jgi:hypothetical protein